MSLDLVRLLEANSGHPRFGPTVQDALGLIEESRELSQHVPGSCNSSLVPARIWKIRRRMGKMRAEALRGIDETIESLEAADVEVQMGSIETDKGFVAVWLAEQPRRLAGVIVGRPDRITRSEA